MRNTVAEKRFLKDKKVFDAAIVTEAPECYVEITYYSLFRTKIRYKVIVIVVRTCTYE